MTRQAVNELNRLFEKGYWVGVFQKPTRTLILRESIPFPPEKWDEYECLESRMSEGSDFLLVAKCRSVSGLKKALDGRLIGEEEKGEKLWNKIMSLFL